MVDPRARDDSELRRMFLEMKSARDLAQLLDVPYDKWVYHIYKVPDEVKYRKFSIPKRTGGVREICAPSSPIVLLQRKLARVLHAVYRPKPSAHGFVRGRSVRTNALPHTRANCVLNIDIADFFPTIHFGRVRGMFMGTPYNLPAQPATHLAQLCCIYGALPQGAPTSPVVSNMLCAKMDSDLQRLARQLRCNYTRYADDITFSSYRRSLPSGLATLLPEGAEIGHVLQDLIAANGFKVNELKTRVSYGRNRREVTGLVVNKKVNVPRRFARQIRAMLHAWDKYGLDAAQEEFARRWDKKKTRRPGLTVQFDRVVRGKIEYLGMVKGKHDDLYVNFMRQYKKLCPACKWEEEPDPFYWTCQHRVWVVETGTTQGTAFYLDDIGFTTCAHVLGNCKKAILYQPHRRHEELSVQVVQCSHEIDLAILGIDGLSIDLASRFGGSQPFRVGTGNSAGLGDPVRVVGYPQHAPGKTCRVVPGHVAGFQDKSGIRRLQLSCGVVAGNSGGPVFDEQGRIIGVAVTGADTFPEIDTVDFHGAIPIEALKQLGA